MSYEPTTWKAGDKVTSAKLNKIEQGIANSSFSLMVEMEATDYGWQSIMDAADIGAAFIAGKNIVVHFPEHGNSNEYPDVYAHIIYYALGSTVNGSEYPKPCFYFASLGSYTSGQFNLLQQLNYLYVDEETGKLVVNYMD